MRGGIHHIDLTVRDAKASFAFYESVLGFMGYCLSVPINDFDDTDPNGYDFDLTTGEGFVSIGT